MNPLSLFHCAPYYEESPKLMAAPSSQQQSATKMPMREPNNSGYTTTVGCLPIEQPQSNTFLVTHCKVQIPGTSQNDPISCLKISVARLRDPSFPGNPPSLHILNNLVTRAIMSRRGTSAVPSFCLKYKDDENDIVDINQSEDLLEALEKPPSAGLKILVFPKTLSSSLVSFQPHTATTVTTAVSTLRNSSASNTMHHHRSPESTLGVFRPNASVVVPSNSCPVVMGLPTTVTNTKKKSPSRTSNTGHSSSVDNQSTDASSSTPKSLSSNKNSSIRSPRKKSSQVAVKMIEASLMRHPNAFIRIPLEDIVDTHESASYFKLVELMLRLFSLPPTSELTFFLKDHRGVLKLVTHDFELSEQIALASSSSSPVLHVQVVDSTLSIGKTDGTLVETPLGAVMSKDGQLSYQKLVNQARMANPSHPIKLLAYLSSSGKRKTISADYSMSNLLQTVGTARNITLHPIFQPNPLTLSPSDSQMAGECNYGEDPPRVRLCATNAVAFWSLSSLAPGRYRVTVQYYRGSTNGSVYVSTGIAPLPQDVFFQPVASRYREVLPEPIYLKATGDSPNSLTNYGIAHFCDFELREKDDDGLAFYVVAQESGQPYMSIQELQLTYLGI